MLSLEPELIVPVRFARLAPTTCLPNTPSPKYSHYIVRFRSALSEFSPNLVLHHEIANWQHIREGDPLLE